MDSSCGRHSDAGADAEQAGARETPAAEHRVDHVDYDVELQRHNAVLRRAYGIRPKDHVLDIGCGAGQTTRDAARFATDGSAVGVDVSAPMIERARQLTEAAGLHNLYFEQADAETHHFPSESFDIAISRFGTMFFADPVAAFANIRRALRPRGRLVMMVWREHIRNEWSVLIERALAAGTDAPDAPPAEPDPFSLADPTTTGRILEAAGFGKASFTDVHESVCYGPDVAAALEWIRGFTSVNDVLQRLDPASTERALERLRQTLGAHASAQGVWCDSHAWIVAADCR
jgi:SAM-dependent methyltransferase